MKKIVALVLALVLALSLATVAFAADTGYVAANADSKIKLENVTMKQVKDAGEKNVAVYNLVLTVNGKEIPMLGNFAVATAADYDLVFVNGEEVTYLKNTLNGGFTGEAKPVATVAKADAKCGDTVAADGVTLYEYNGQILKAADSFNLGTVLTTAIKEHAQDMIENYTFTKADWQAAVKHYLTHGAWEDAWDLMEKFYDGDTSDNETRDGNQDMTFNDVCDVLRNAVTNIAIYAEQSYFGSELGRRVGSERQDIIDVFTNRTVKGEIEDVYEGWVNSFVDAFVNTFAAEDNLWKIKDVSFMGMKLNDIGEKLDSVDDVKAVLINLFKDAKNEVVQKVCEALGIVPGSGKSWMAKSEAAAHNESVTLNIAREIGKMATSVKAVAVADGKLVTLVAATADDYTVVAHDYAVEVVDGAIAKVSCKTCKAEFAFVVGCEKDAAEKFGADYADITTNFQKSFTSKFLGKHVTEFDWDMLKLSSDWAEGTGYYWDLLDAEAREIVKALGVNHLYVSTAEVESAKTFDAGIALYAGLALMSVTGSAVVIGKKKEF